MLPLCMPSRHAGGMVRDLLYLSENKMRALVPQLPGQLRRRLGFEAGLNAGVASAKASLSAESQPSSIALLDSVVEMIEREKGSRWRTDSDLRAGDWIQFEEEFRYGDAATADYLRSPLLRHDQAAGHALSGLVYFAATDAEVPPFVLCGSSVHVLDRWQPGDSPDKRVGHFYMDALVVYARQLAELPDEAATTEFVPPEIGLSGFLLEALLVLRRKTRDDRSNGWVTGPVRLSGHARVLAAGPLHATGGPPWMLATPLYVEYAQRG
jgi:hypothetical protein